MLSLLTLIAQAEPTPPKPAIQIPGFEGFSQATQDATNAAVLQVPYLSEYLAALFRFAVGAGAVVAAFMIAIGGFQYIASAGIPKQVGAAKKKITNALTGLVLLMGTYIILYSLSPDLVAMKSISLLTVPRVQLQDSGNETEHVHEGEIQTRNTAFAIEQCPDLVSIADIPGLIPAGPNAHMALRKAPAEALANAVAEWIAAGNQPLTVNRDFRSTAEQTELYEGYKANKPGYAKAAKPGTSNHERGSALDLSTAALSTTEYTQLLKIMEKHGFRVLGNGTYTSANVPDNWKEIPERWHFDYTKDKIAKLVECQAPASTQAQQEFDQGPTAGARER